MDARSITEQNGCGARSPRPRFLATRLAYEQTKMAWWLSVLLDEVAVLQIVRDCCVFTHGAVAYGLKKELAAFSREAFDDEVWHALTEDAEMTAAEGP